MHTVKKTLVTLPQDVFSLRSPGEREFRHRALGGDRCDVIREGMRRAQLPRGLREGQSCPQLHQGQHAQGEHMQTALIYELIFI